MISKVKYIVSDGMVSFSSPLKTAAQVYSPGNVGSVEISTLPSCAGYTWQPSIVSMVILQDVGSALLVIEYDSTAEVSWFLQNSFQSFGNEMYLSASEIETVIFIGSWELLPRSFHCAIHF